MSRETIYLDGGIRTIEYHLQSKDFETNTNKTVNLADIIRMTIEIGNVIIDSDETGGNGEGNPFYWIGGLPEIYQPNLIMSLSGQALPLGAAEARLTVFYSETEWLVWTQLPVKVVE